MPGFTGEKECPARGQAGRNLERSAPRLFDAIPMFKSVPTNQSKDAWPQCGVITDWNHNLIPALFPPGDWLVPNEPVKSVQFLHAGIAPTKQAWAKTNESRGAVQKAERPGDDFDKSLVNVQ